METLLEQKVILKHTKDLTLLKKYATILTLVTLKKKSRGSSRVTTTFTTKFFFSST